MAKNKRTMELNSTAIHSPEMDIELVRQVRGKTKKELSIQQLTPADFPEEDLLKIYRTMLLSRRLDEKMINLLKQGKGFFHIGCAGHEAAQAAVAYFSRPGSDWFVPYYRDLCMSLSLGMTSRDTLLAHLAKADDPNSGGRQMAEHFSSPELNIITTSSSVGAQYLPALGAGMAMQRSGKDGYVYVSSGDGATSQGDFHEALNWATRIQAPVMFFVQDNGYAISVPVSEQTAGGSAYKFGAGYEGIVRARVDGTDFFRTASVAKAAIEHIRSGHGPVLLLADVVRLMPHSSSDNHAKYRTTEELEKDKQVDPIARLELSLIEAGLLSEKSATQIRKEIRQQVDADTAWAEAQPDPDPASAIRHVFFEGELNLEYEKTKPNGDLVVMVDAINHALDEEMGVNEKIVVYGEDVAGDKGGVFTATRNLTKKYGPKRCFNSPLAEASVIGTAVGFSAAGYRPVVEIQFADYIWPAMQQLRNQLASFRYRSNGKWGCPVVIRVPCGGYIHGGLCHSQNIESIFGHTPGIKVVMPSTAADAKGLLKTAMRMEDPVLFLEHKGLYRASQARSKEPDADYMIPFGKAHVVKAGTDLSIITYGLMVHKALAAAKTVEKQGVSVEVIDLRSLVPLDTEAILATVRKTGRALVLYEDHEFLGYGAEISAQIADKAFEYLDAPVRRVAGAFSYIPFADPLERAVLPQDKNVLDGIRELLNW